MKKNAMELLSKAKSYRDIIIKDLDSFRMKDVQFASFDSVVAFVDSDGPHIEVLKNLISRGMVPTQYSVIAEGKGMSNELYYLLEREDFPKDGQPWGANNFPQLFDSAISELENSVSLIDFDKPIYNSFGEVKIQRKDGQKDDDSVSITMRVNGSKLTYPVSKKTGEPIAVGMSIEHYSVSNEQFDAVAPIVDDTESATNESDYRFEIPSFLSDFLKAKNISDKNVVVVKLK
tara:strand:+ start:1328 stop:2023 length:696 start_codon:yes stop_codon:yes gene_type:complete